MIDALRQVEGAYSLVALSQEGVIGVRDPLGVRPLVLGRLGEAWILASETCALDIIGADFVRDVEPGEMVIIERRRRALASSRSSARASALCIFEYIYFARPDSVVDGISVYEARKRIGAELARESHVAADVVIPVPDSGVPAAIGYAAECGLPVRARHHPQPLCRPHLHRADRPDPPSRRQAQAQRQPRQHRRASASSWSTIRSCAAPPRPRSSRWCARPARARCICASPARRPRIPASTASPRRSATSSSPSRMAVDGDGDASSAPTASPSSRSTGSTAPWARRGASPRRRNIATPASPATTPIPLVDHDAGKVSTQLSLLAETA